MNTYELHPLCTLFPRMQGLDFDGLCTDIKFNGLREPIVLHDGMILDGGNRYRACLRVGIEPVFKQFEGPSVVAFVLSVNLHRRHMTPGQQAAIVASATDWGKAQKHGGDRKADQGEGLHLETSQQRAAVSGATTRTQKDADKLARENPDKAKEVAQGTTSLYQAVKEAKLPKQPKPVQASAQAPAQPEKPDTDDFDPVAELEKQMAINAGLQAQITAAEANDLKAEAMKWRRAYEHAQRTADDKMANAARLDKELQQLHNRMLRIGKLFGERDPVKIPALVESFYRQHAKVAA